MITSVCFVQVRRGSTRLHEKMLQKINGIPLLFWVTERVRLLGVDKVVFCAPKVDESSEFGSILKQNCKENGFFIYWGSEKDVASRFVQAIDFYLQQGIIQKPFHLTRVCGDRPFLEPAFYKVLIENIHKYDLVYNHHIDGLFTGFGFEVINTSYLERTFFAENHFKFLDKEHVTLKFYSDESCIQRMIVPKGMKNLHFDQLKKFDIDTFDDLSFINEFVSDYNIEPSTENVYLIAMEKI